MRLKDYGRSPEKRKEFLQQPGLLIVGIDVSKAKHTACIGTQAAVLCQNACGPDHACATRLASGILSHWIGWPLRSETTYRSRLTCPAPHASPTLTGACSSVQPVV